MNNCKMCGGATKRQFCSISCSNKYNGQKRLNENKGDHMSCVTCGKLKSRSNFSYKIRNDITSGKKDQCKRCGANDRERQRRERSWQDDAAGQMLVNSRQRAKRDGLEHTLTKEDIVIPEYCPVLGIKLSQEARNRKHSGPSIDRVDNARGYTPDNIVVVSCRANLLKRDATVSELRRLADFYEHVYS